MEKVCKLGTTSSHAGSIISGCTSAVLTDGIQTAVDGCLHSCPIPGHGITPVAGTGLTTVDGKNKVKVGDAAGCGATMVTGSDVVSVE